MTVKVHGGSDRRHAQEVLCSHTNVLPQHMQLVLPLSVDLEELCRAQRYNSLLTETKT